MLITVHRAVFPQVFECFSDSHGQHLSSQHIPKETRNTAQAAVVIFICSHVSELSGKHATIIPQFAIEDSESTTMVASSGSHATIGSMRGSFNSSS